MSQAQLKVSRIECSDSPALALWTISNPGAKNALSPDMYSQGLDAINQFAADPSLAVAVLTGEDGFFCAGGNLQRLLNNRSLPADVQRQSIDGLHAWVSALRACPKPVIAAVDGAAAGAGFSLALACDLIVASANAKFVMAYVNVGLTPDGGASKALVEHLPATLVFELCALGQSISGERLGQLGVVNRVTLNSVDAEGKATAPALSEAIKLAHQLALKAPSALTNIKRLIFSAPNLSWPEHLLAERESFVEQLYSAEGQIGIEAFLNKHKPKFR